MKHNFEHLSIPSPPAIPESVDAIQKDWYVPSCKPSGHHLASLATMAWIDTTEISESTIGCRCKCSIFREISTWHDDAIKLKKKSAILALCEGTVTRGFDPFYSISDWINGWANNQDAGDLKRCHANYDATVNFLCNLLWLATEHFFIS